ncbi:uncharacterized protein LOC129582722 [Paramacrobiotus metropolitanus]|uniref:uncharacterized protein LOC129582722 n=1 Tax=Paramacrobiotus metropolitanus TaxID=2943436 RepID=UPI002445E4BC|nr:uncharacterized protein LOC129582722 [Paramacrobiotus metropolitanus]
MEKVFIVFSLLIGVCWSQSDSNSTNGKYVFDMYLNTPPLDPDGVVDILIAAKPGETFPLLHSVPNTGFSCGQFKYPGYYADTSPGSRCQAFYRCEINGNQTGFLCPNSTLFNQLTLTCDYYFNVDCNGSSRFYEFGNSRLYHGEQPLFDTPPKGYISALSGLPQSSGDTGGPAGSSAPGNNDANDLQPASASSSRDARLLNTGNTAVSQNTAPAQSGSNTQPGKPSANAAAKSAR